MARLVTTVQGPWAALVDDDDACVRQSIDGQDSQIVEVGGPQQVTFFRKSSLPLALAALHGRHVACSAGDHDHGVCITVELPTSRPADGRTVGEPMVVQGA